MQFKIKSFPHSGFKIAMDTEGNPMRGADLMGGMCLGCHSAASTDYVFSK